VNTAITGTKANAIISQLHREHYNHSVPLSVSHSEKNFSSATVIARRYSSIGMQYL
jgi:hypothetical protein